jgi:hypothetical protein
MRKVICFAFTFFLSYVATANNMLVQNVTTTGNNATNKTIQVQFDLSWDNSWRDAINWDAAWIFMKYKDANGAWQHVQLNTTGFANGSGTVNTVQVTFDRVGAWVYRSAAGSGTFNSTSMQLQWNYGLNGLNDVTGLEVRVFAVEMVYVPQGEFNISKTFSIDGSQTFRSFSAPGNNFPVINNRLTPELTYNDGYTVSTIRVKGDAGIDINNDGLIDKPNYPIGYRAFYNFKYELTEQQFADFLNTLTTSQISNVGLSGSNITLSNGQYFTSSPNRACGNATVSQFLSYGDWCGLRPMSFFEFNKSSYGSNQPVLIDYIQSLCGPVSYYSASTGSSTNFGDLMVVGYYSSGNSTQSTSGASCYGIFELSGNAHEPISKLGNFDFLADNGDGVLGSDGLSNQSNWNLNNFEFIDVIRNASGGMCPQSFFLSSKFGFRYVRSAE